MAVDSLLDFLEFLDVAFENFHFLLQLLVVFSDLENAILVFVLTANATLLALLASGGDLRASLEVLLQLLERESVVVLLLFARIALEGAGKLQWRLFFARRLQMLDHCLVVPRLLFLFSGGFLLSLVLASLALWRLFLLIAVTAATRVKFDS